MTTRSTWWSITAFNGEAELLCASMEGKSEVPTFVKEIHGGMEKCPTTAKEHFQGALHTEQIRMSQIKKWLPTAHIEKAKNKNALIKYALKADTAVGEKSSMENSNYMSVDNLVRELIIYRFHNITEQLPSVCESKYEYHKLVNHYYMNRYEKARKLMSILGDPRTYRVYSMFARSTQIIYEQELSEEGRSSTVPEED